jgi:hypothetical protein
VEERETPFEVRLRGGRTLGGYDYGAESRTVRIDRPVISTARGEGEHGKTRYSDSLHQYLPYLERLCRPDLGFRCYAADVLSSSVLVDA